MDPCKKCGKDTESRVNFIKKALVCTVCGEVKGPAPQQKSTSTVVVESPVCRAIVNVSTDEWVMMASDSGAWLYTEGLIGCVGLVVQSRDRVALAHVLDRNGPSVNDLKAASYQLELIAAVLGSANILSIDVIITDIDRDTRTFNLVRDWALRYVAKNDLEVTRGANCVLVRPEKDPDRRVIPGQKLTPQEHRLLTNPGQGVQWITNWGKLPQWNGHTE